MPVSVLQLGLGAWQRGVIDGGREARGWQHVAQLVADWAVLDMDGHGRFVHHQPMPHTYRIDAGWHSAMAQALGVSLLTREGRGGDATRAARSLLEREFGLITDTSAGPILEEYPAEPRPHVLNGWIWALLGLSDLTIAAECGVHDDVRSEASGAFEAGVRSLVAHLPEYETGRGWSTYDRYPHAIANVASPFYHRLHVEMLRALARVAPVDCIGDLESTAVRWEAALARPTTRATAVARKVGFRIVTPRHRRVA